ncbi:polysaccharide pyruvyl transferase family protein [Proteus mirabilis]|uniref:polysaccharide pyruvyl transferase family protein n=1 Tax=Proteus mirabilis TaxID=584 RepID=UPI0013D16435|nr:polysaccharide pyruvyl transferase family protein [Proteus mirabilis]MBI6260272.1 polysaccharide pyruvyl transferase family protein [Proteus mirabilis]HEK1816849.1 polysaccharide pyruvyl transferase family protein [Proteus mirabilis]HEK2144208.1 polysaccharide pyruvyl transferase family protein [Proteus mirabilis]HEK2856934.1 polysaccharide pyruvyl transferase family protein [Proteus mirabilis]HEK3218526.1 polysaccharide pyruvyl transferase family protein [Proteus mirabilis]
MKILCVNESQSLNLGDQLINKGLKNLLNNEVDSINISNLPFSFSPSTGQKKDNSRKNFFKSLYNLKPIKKILLPIRSIVFNIKRLSLLKYEIKKNDFILFGGGSLLINNSLVFPINLFFITFLCKIYQKPYGFAGISCRNIQNKLAKFLIKSSIKNAKFIYMRDFLSCQIILQQYNISTSYIPDLALYIGLQNIEIESNHNIAINIMGKQSHGFFSNNNNFYNYIRNIINFIYNSSFNEYHLFTTGEKSDFDAIQILISLLPLHTSKNITISQYPISINEVEHKYKEYEYFLCTRLHSAIIALSYGKKFITFNWDKKIEGFMNTYNLTFSLFNSSTNFEKYFPLFSSRVTIDKSLYLPLINSLKENISTKS